MRLTHVRHLPMLFRKTNVEGKREQSDCWEISSRKDFSVILGRALNPINHSDHNPINHNPIKQCEVH